MPAILRKPTGLLAKALTATALIGFADWLFLFHRAGGSFGLFALVWTLALFALQPALRRGWPALTMAAATLLALLLIERPTMTGWILFWSALSSAALLPRYGFDQALLWGGRLFSYGAIGLAAPVRDLRRVLRIGSGGGDKIGRLLGLLALPLIGTAMFGLLFASANPVIGGWIDAIRMPNFDAIIAHALFCGFMLVMVWPSLRPRAMAMGAITALPHRQGRELPVATLLLSLAAFNAIFAVQNALDIAFLWSGAPLPGNVTLAEYAHQGAYLLIATTLLAGLFVLVALRPGSVAAKTPLIRWLVVLWIAQNLILVASSMVRTLDYVEAFSLTAFRIEALAWMALVGGGLVLICWRMLTGRTTAWLINANAATALAVLIGFCVFDAGAIAAEYNVRRARTSADLDLCYLNWLGPSALIPLIELERRAVGPKFQDQVASLRAGAQAQLEREQDDWHSWTWRGARRLAQAEAMLKERPGYAAIPDVARGCDGSPLTAEGQR